MAFSQYVITGVRCVAISLHAPGLVCVQHTFIFECIWLPIALLCSSVWVQSKIYLTAAFNCDVVLPRVVWGTLRDTMGTRTVAVLGDNTLRHNAVIIARIIYNSHVY